MENRLGGERKSDVVEYQFDCVVMFTYF